MKLHDIRKKRVDLAFAAVAAGVVVWVLFQPVSHDELWWDLARGRAAFDGDLSPSSSLLVHETRPEAAWASGLPAYTIWLFTGPYGLMAGRVCCGIALVWWLLKRTGSLHSSIRMALVSTAVVAAAPGLDLVGRFTDVASAVFAIEIAIRSRKWRAGARCLAAFLVTGLWSNVGATPFLACLIFAISWSDEISAPSSRRGPASLLANSGCVLASLAGMLVTPAGLNGPIQSLLAFATDQSGTTGISSSLRTNVTLAHTAALALPLLSLMVSLLLLTGRAASSRILLAGSSLLIGFSSPVNASAAAIVLVHSVSGLPGPSSAWPRRIGVATAFTAVGCLGISLVSQWPVTRPGFGLHEKLDYRLVDAAVNDVQVDGTVLAIDIRSAGMLAWIRPEFTIQDTKQHARMSGRLRTWQLLEKDIRAQRRNSYIRTDGTTGGWWRALTERHTDLIIFSSEDCELARSLEPTIWKPLVIDAPVLVYGKAGDGRVIKPMLAAIAQRQFMNSGDWGYQPPAPSGSEFDRDCWGLRENVWPDTRSLELARLLRCMDQRIGALRILHHLAGDGVSGAERTEFHLCNRELSWHELLLSGQSSPLRDLTTDNLDESPSTFLQNYWRGDLSRLSGQLAGLKLDETEKLYAQALLVLESGNRRDAQRILEDLGTSGTLSQRRRIDFMRDLTEE